MPASGQHPVVDDGRPWELRLVPAGGHGAVPASMSHGELDVPCGEPSPELLEERHAVVGHALLHDQDARAAGAHDASTSSYVESSRRVVTTWSNRHSYTARAPAPRRRRSRSLR